MSGDNNKKKPREDRALRVPLYEKLKDQKSEKFITCNICGNKYKNLAAHLYKTHNISPEEYIIDYPETTHFLSDELRINKSLQNNNYLRHKRRMLTDDEIAFVKDNFQKMTNNEIARQLDLPLSSIQGIIKKYIPERKIDAVPWSAEDVEFLKINHKRMTYIEIAAQLGRGVETVRAKGHKLGLNRDGPSVPARFFNRGAPKPLVNNNKLWIKKEDNYLRNKYINTTIHDMARFLGRTERSVITRMDFLGLSVKDMRNRNSEVRFWSEDEILFLRKHYHDMDKDELCLVLQRTWHGIVGKARELNLRRGAGKSSWSEDEIIFLKNNYKTMTYAEIGEKLNRTKKAVMSKITELKLTKTEPYRNWTENDYAYLKKNYAAASCKQLAEYFKCSVPAVKSRIRSLGLKKK